MGILLKLLALPITGPTNGLMAIFRTIQNEVEREDASIEAIQRRLVELQQMLEAGELDEVTYEVLEEKLLDKLDALYEEQEQAQDGNTS